jgi:hypothetical protein
MLLITSSKGSRDIKNLSPAPKVKPLQCGTLPISKCKMSIISNKTDETKHKSTRSQAISFATEYATAF